MSRVTGVPRTFRLPPRSRQDPAGGLSAHLRERVFPVYSGDYLDRDSRYDYHLRGAEQVVCEREYRFFRSFAGDSRGFPIFLRSLAVQRCHAPAADSHPRTRPLYPPDPLVLSTALRGCCCCYPIPPDSRRWCCCYPVSPDSRRNPLLQQL